MFSLCESCYQQHNGAYGSGRFCSSACARSFSTAKKRKSINARVSIKLSKPKTTRLCLVCNKTFVVKKKQQKFCTKTCAAHHGLSCINLSAAGKASAKSQSEKRRSLNEISFFQLCYAQFTDSLSNVAVFDGWDADIVIPSLKIAVMWNGKWHYEKITAKHSVKQVQNRDSIKLQKIITAGYIPYVIKDMGRHNIEFVKEQFEKFLLFIKLGPVGFEPTTDAL